MSKQPKTAHSVHSSASSLNPRLACQFQECRTKYRYDPFGNTISSSGTLASANVYRFSSKEYHLNSGMYYYGYRFYDPNLQRWITRDPSGEQAGINLYTFVDNDPEMHADPDGRMSVLLRKTGRKVLSATPLGGPWTPPKCNIVSIIEYKFPSGQCRLKTCVYDCFSGHYSDEVGRPYTRRIDVIPCSRPCPNPASVW